MTKTKLLEDFEQKFVTEEGIKLRDIDVDIRADVVKRLISQAYDSATLSLIEEAKKRLEGDRQTGECVNCVLYYGQIIEGCGCVCNGFNAGLSRALEVLDNLKQQV